MRASIMARVEVPKTLEATEEILIPASCSTLSRRWISWARTTICVLR
jgi:hypothetical protein